MEYVLSNDDIKQHILSSGLQPKHTVLHIGMSNSDVVYLLQHMGIQKIIAIDDNIKELEYLKSRVEAEQKNYPNSIVEFYAADIGKKDFLSSIEKYINIESIDAVYMKYVLCHCTKSYSNTIIDNIMILLKKGGCIINQEAIIKFPTIKIENNLSESLNRSPIDNLKKNLELYTNNLVEISNKYNINPLLDEELPDLYSNKGCDVLSYDILFRGHTVPQFIKYFDYMIIGYGKLYESEIYVATEMVNYFSQLKQIVVHNNIEIDVSNELNNFFLKINRPDECKNYVSTKSSLENIDNIINKSNIAIEKYKKILNIFYKIKVCLNILNNDDYKQYVSFETEGPVQMICCKSF
jgi:SAM-dependent methyltransferase